MFNLISPVVGDDVRCAVVPLGTARAPFAKSIVPSTVAVVPLSLVTTFLSASVTTNLLAEYPLIFTVFVDIFSYPLIVMSPTCVPCSSERIAANSSSLSS